MAPPKITPLPSMRRSIAFANLAELEAIVESGELPWPGALRSEPEGSKYRALLARTLVLIRDTCKIAAEEDFILDTTDAVIQAPGITNLDRLIKAARDVTSHSDGSGQFLAPNSFVSWNAVLGYVNQPVYKTVDGPCRTFVAGNPSRTTAEIRDLYKDEVTWIWGNIHLMIRRNVYRAVRDLRGHFGPGNSV